MTATDRAADLLRNWKGHAYDFGDGALAALGKHIVDQGTRILVLTNSSPWLADTVRHLLADIRKAGGTVIGDRTWPGARPNSPRADVYRIESTMLHHEPDCIVALGGGSTIDAVKAGNVLAALGDLEADIDPFFGVGLVTAALQQHGRQLTPLVAVQTAAGSAAHLTKYANVTDLEAGQKKLIVDEALIPVHAAFDYHVTATAPPDLTLDGALDSIAHSLEVYYGAGADNAALTRELATLTIELVLSGAPAAVADPKNLQARTQLGLAADLGGYAIMVGGTNGAHLTSFSLVDATSHGRACGIMNPYYTVFFAPAIEERVRAVGEVYRGAGYIAEELSSLHGRDLGEAVARGMLAFARTVGMPTTLRDLPGFTADHIDRALAAARNPQLDMKLKNMPVPLDASLIDDYMAPILEAAETGDLSRIRTMP